SQNGTTACIAPSRARAPVSADGKPAPRPDPSREGEILLSRVRGGRNPALAGKGGRNPALAGREGWGMGRDPALAAWGGGGTRECRTGGTRIPTPPSPPRAGSLPAPLPLRAGFLPALCRREQDLSRWSADSRTSRGRDPAVGARGWLVGRAGAGRAGRLLLPDVGADGGAQDGAELALGDRAVRRERLEDVPDVPDERAVARVLAVRGDQVAEAAVGRVDVLHARVDPADDDGLAGVGAVSGLRLLRLDDGEGHRAVGGVAGG